MNKEPLVTIKGYVLARDYPSINARFIEKIDRLQNGIFTLDCPNVEDAIKFSDENQAKTWCLIINKELMDQNDLDLYVPLRYMSALQELEEDKKE